jgi:hypothetical protein
MYRILAGKPEDKRPTGRTGESGTFGFVLDVKLWAPAVTGEAKNKLTVPLSVVEAGYVDVCMYVCMRF